MNRTQFLKAVAERAGAHKRDVEHVWENALAVIQDSIRKGEKVGITGFGTFKQRLRKAGLRKNPQTGATIRVPSMKLPRFLPAKPFKLYVAGQVKALPKATTKPMALAADGGKKAAPKKGAPKRAAAAKKGKAKKAAPKKGAKKTARRR